ncbi:histidinol-phosphate transaminase [Limnohabitans sp. Jir72]|nr:histidinol-phosphate transaminase [Limnohabitans sp. Jir72]
MPGEQPQTSGWIKLNTNENPYPPSVRVLEAIAGGLDEGLRLYPDPNGNLLRASIARRFDLSPEHVFLGNGSDEVLGHVFPALLKHDLPVLFPDITYSFYPVYCGLFGIRHQQVPLDADFQIRISDYQRPNGGIVLANPNAPTGVALPLTQIRELLTLNTDSVVVIDEAYVDFGGQSAASLIQEFPQLLVVQTLSKSRSLAGLRAAFALGQPHLIAALERVKNSFNSYPLDRLALLGAQAAMEDDDHLKATCEAVIHTREGLVRELSALGFDTLPSQANFILTRHPLKDAAELLRQLRERKILVRHFALPRIEQHLRISVGTPAECQTLIEALKDILNAFSSEGTPP